MVDDVMSRRLEELWRRPENSGEYLFMSWAGQDSNGSAVMRSVQSLVEEFGLGNVRPLQI
jgi:hypothetical protein